VSVAALGGKHGSPPDAVRGRRRALPWRRPALALIWIASFAASLLSLWPLAMIFDSDSYYHLAIAREYGQHGQLADLPWARFSVMQRGYGDKELLFHWLLAPFAAAADPLLGAKLALAGLIATLCASLAALGSAAIGGMGLWLPALLLCGSLSFDVRLIRLRPELLALILLLWSVHALIERRTLLLAALAASFALAYTAIHVELGLLAAGWLGMRWIERARPHPSGAGAHPSVASSDWALLLLPFAAAAAALCLHPHFPQNLRVFWLQNAVFWGFSDSADVGLEIRPLGWLEFLQHDWPLLLGCVLLALSARRSELDADARRVARAASVCFGPAALVFCALFVRSERFATFALPFALLALAWTLRARGYQLGPHLGSSAGPRTWLALALVCCVALPLTAAKLIDVVDRGGCLWPAQRAQLERLGRTLPAGAKVAAPWIAAQDYLFFAPQGRYLNVLDPVFMRAADERAYLAQRRLFDGQLADVPLALQSALDSDYLAFNARTLPALHAQVERDPRLHPLIAGGQALYRFDAAGGEAFVREWRVASSRSQLRDAPAYPRAPDPRARAAEGFIDAARVDGAGRCLWFAPSEPPPPGRYELGSDSPLTLARGGLATERLAADRRPVLGRGRLIELGGQALEIELCSGERPGVFYLLRR
jgi:hypothetical protein